MTYKRRTIVPMCDLCAPVALPACDHDKCIHSDDMAAVYVVGFAASHCISFACCSVCSSEDARNWGGGSCPCLSLGPLLHTFDDNS